MIRWRASFSVYDCVGISRPEQLKSVGGFGESPRGVQRNLRSLQRTAESVHPFPGTVQLTRQCPTKPSKFPTKSEKPPTNRQKCLPIPGNCPTNKECPTKPSKCPTNSNEPPTNRRKCPHIPGNCPTNKGVSNKTLEVSNKLGEASNEPP